MPPRYHPTLLPVRLPSTFIVRSYTTSSSKPIIHIPPNSSIYAFGSPAHSRTPLIRDIGWTVREGEAWAVVSGSGSGGGSGGKGAVFKTLLGHTRIAPPTPAAQAAWAHAGGLYPFLAASSVDPYTKIAHVSFRQRSSSGGFFDYTARYGALWEAEDRITLRGSLGDLNLEDEKRQLFEELSQRMGLQDLLDLPLVALSNGQTRRARIVKAILDGPEVLLLDEPLTGLDPPSRSALTAVLAHLHQSQSHSQSQSQSPSPSPTSTAQTRTSAPRVILGLRKGSHIPAWVTHVLEVGDGEGRAVVRSPGYFQGVDVKEKCSKPTTTTRIGGKRVGEVLVDMRGVNVAYGERRVLQDITWQIRQGERWHLQGANGSGKTTVLALLTGDHPQSYTQKHLLLPSFSTTPTTASPSTASLSTTSPSPASSSAFNSNPITHTLQLLLQKRTPQLLPRKRTPTAHLRRLIGVVSPEMFDAFPRRHPGMSVWEAVGTGFDGGFVPRTRDVPRATRAETTRRAEGAVGVVNGMNGMRGMGGKGGVGWVDVSDEEVDLALVLGARGLVVQGLKGTGGEEVNINANGADREATRERIREWRIERCWEVLHSLGPAAYAPAPSSSPSSPSTSSTPSPQTLTFAQKPFTALPPGEQRLVLLMRALVGRPPIVLLDEVWSGMDAGMVRAARDYLRGEGGADGPGEDWKEVGGNGGNGIKGNGEGGRRKGVDDTQAVVVITHWEEEVPWEGDEVRRFKLE